jgi:hypothetical protein
MCEFYTVHLVNFGRFQDVDSNWPAVTCRYQTLSYHNLVSTRHAARDCQC